jgi:hypothetical protein
VVTGVTTTVDFTLRPNQPLNILPYAAAALVIIATVGIAVYLQRRKKAT